MLNLHQLAVFRVVARHLNFSRAAEALHLTQPAVTRHVQQLERQFGLALLTRQGRRMQLTDAGRDVVLYTQRIDALVDELDSVLDAYRGLRRGRVRLSATTTAGEYILPPLVAGFRRQHPRVDVALHVANREGVVQALATGAADLAVMGRPPDRPHWPRQAILPNELVAIGPPHHPRAAGPPFAALELKSETFFVREQGSGTRRAVEQFLEEVGLPTDALVELGSDSAIKQVVMADLGISILSRQAIELEVSVGRLAVLPVHELPLRRVWFLVQPSVDRPAPAVAAFIQFLEQATGARSHPSGMPFGTA